MTETKRCQGLLEFFMRECLQRPSYIGILSVLLDYWNGSLNSCIYVYCVIPTSEIEGMLIVIRNIKSFRPCSMTFFSSTVFSRDMTGNCPQNEMQWKEVKVKKERWKTHFGPHMACHSHGVEWDCLEHVTRIYVRVKKLIWPIQYLRWMSGDLFSVRDRIVSQGDSPISQIHLSNIRSRIIQNAKGERAIPKGAFQLWNSLLKFVQNICYVFN